MDLLKQLVKTIFQYEARLILKRYKPKVIAITGSVGKTLAKEAIYSIISKNFFVRKSEKSFTTQLGVPLAIIGCPRGTGSALEWLDNIFFGIKILFKKNSYPEWLILEIDADKPGDINSVSSWLRPDILIMTAIGEVPSHIEAFQSFDVFLSEKTNIINSVKKDGVIIYNADDSVVCGLVKDVPIRKVSCGVKNDADIKGSLSSILYSNTKSHSIPNGMTFDIIFQNNNYSINILETLGIQNEYASLIAFASSLELKIPIEKIVSILNKYSKIPGRMTIISGINDSVILDDSYNSSPLAVAESISTFSNIITQNRKIAVIGDMLELGKYSHTEHKNIAVQLKDVANLVYCVGIRSRKIKEELVILGFDEDKVFTVGTSSEAGEVVSKILLAGDLVLVKGSQAIRMEKVVEKIMKHPEDKKKLLIRQDKEWQNR